MKIKADYANAPMWKELTVKSSLPEELKCYCPQHVVGMELRGT